MSSWDVSNFSCKPKCKEEKDRLFFYSMKTTSRGWRMNPKETWSWWSTTRETIPCSREITNCQCHWFWFAFWFLQYLSCCSLLIIASSSSSSSALFSRRWYSHLRASSCLGCSSLINCQDRSRLSSFQKESRAFTHQEMHSSLPIKGFTRMRERNRN